MAPLHNFLALFVLALSLKVFSAALPAQDGYPLRSVPQSEKICSNPLKRKEWRMLEDNEKKDYIDAVLCLQRLPSKADHTEVPGAKTRWDDFVAVHITHSRGYLEKNGGVHFVGQFLPWHRYLLIAFENALRGECGYKGALPYWNWTMDTEPGMDLRDSPVFDPITGFGGDGQQGVTLPPSRTRIDIPGGTGGGCVLNGPFVNLTLNIGPGDSLNYNPRCLARSLNPTMNMYMNYSNIAPLAETTTFEQFDYLIQSTPRSLTDTISIALHGSGHMALGVECADVYSSNCEPLFYLHHAYLDALWLDWQLADPTGSRFFDISGPQIIFTSEPQVTLDFLIDLGEAGPPIPISKVMNTAEGNIDGVGCYQYEW